MEQALTCPLMFVRVLLVCPEDLGGAPKVGHSSMLELGEVKSLDGVNDAHSLEQTSDIHWVFSPNLSHFKWRMSKGWPSLYLVSQDLLYSGALPPSCQSSPAHPPLRGVDSHGEFHSSSF